MDEHLEKPPIKKYIYRGGYEFPAQAQSTKRDLDGEEIVANPEAKVHCYMLTKEQQKAREGQSLNYHILVYSPESAAISWTAFYTIAEFRVFCHTYNIKIDGEVKSGNSFNIIFPVDSRNFEPLHIALRYGGEYHFQIFQNIDDETKRGIEKGIERMTKRHLSE